MLPNGPYCDIECKRAGRLVTSSYFCMNGSDDLQGWPLYYARGEVFHPMNKYFFKDAKLHLCNQVGEWQNCVSSYTPFFEYTPSACCPVTFCVTIQCDYYKQVKPCMGCYVGARISTADPKYNGPARMRECLYLAFNSGNVAYLYTGNKKNWPMPSAELSVPCSFAQPQTLYVTDFGNKIEYSVIVEQTKVLFCSINILEHELIVEDRQGNVICRESSTISGVKSGFFSVFSHFASILQENEDSGNQQICFKDKFEQYYRNDYYRVVQFASRVNDFFVNGRNASFAKGQLLLLSPCDLYEDPKKYDVALDIRFNRAYLACFFYVDLIDELFEGFKNQTVILGNEDFTHFEEVKNRLQNYKLHNNIDYIYIYEMLQILIKQPLNVALFKGAISNRINDIIHFMENNVSMITSLDDIAEHFYISKYYLCHIFKKYTKITIVEYLNKIRIQKACSVIQQNPNRTISEVATLCGFNTIQYFSSIFKKNMGISPHQYKKKYLHETSATFNKN